MKAIKIHHTPTHKYSEGEGGVRRSQHCQECPGDEHAQLKLGLETKGEKQLTFSCTQIQGGS